MSNWKDAGFGAGHNHVFLGEAHEQNERKTWMVIALCSAMMVAEIAGGSLFGSLALIADGLHMSTHAGAMLIAALAYTYARKHATDSRFVFGTGKLGDLAGFTSAVGLAMIALLIAYEAVLRFFSPVPIHFGEAIPIAVVGLLVNLASVWLLSGDHHGHSHGHGHGHSDAHGHADTHSHEDEVKRILAHTGVFELSIYKDGVPPVFRVTPEAGTQPLSADAVSVTTVRPDGSRQTFSFVDRDGYLESIQQVPEPHAFRTIVRLPGEEHSVDFVEHDHEAHAGTMRDHNMRAAYVHVMADAAVSVLAIIGLVLARAFGWNWMDPLAGVVGALVIANWSYGLIRDTGAILLDMNRDGRMTVRVRQIIEGAGDRVLDLHVWRVGPGHLSVIISVVTNSERRPDYYRSALAHIEGLSHLTVEVNPSSNK